MSTRRKLKRKGRDKAAAAGKNFASRTSAERFKTPGSEKLWSALLGWPDGRLVRMWLLDAVHDGVRERAAPEAVVKAFAARRADLAKELSPDDVAKALELWRDAGEGDQTHFHYLAALMERLGLSATGAEELAADWKAWTSLSVASPAHKALLASLAQAEQAAAMLLETTQSESVRSAMTVLRGLFLGLAYGDAQALRNLQDASEVVSRPE